MKFITPLTAAIALCAAFASVQAVAQTQTAAVADTRSAFARQLYASAPADVHDDAPQALLRAVVVLRVRLADDGRWSAEVLRDNSTQPELTRKALESVSRLPAPTGLSSALREELRQNGFIEAWLFQDDGRYALKTLARPQKRG